MFKILKNNNNLNHAKIIFNVKKIYSEFNYKNKKNHSDSNNKLDKKNKIIYYVLCVCL